MVFCCVLSSYLSRIFYPLIICLIVIFLIFQCRYDERIDRVETRITARLRDQLGTAKNANEMFRIFSRFNALFVRPHIRGAIREYQTQLIQRVKDDIESLHEKFKVAFTFLGFIFYAKCFLDYFFSTLIYYFLYKHWLYQRKR